MHELFNTMPYTGYVYPNETVIPWSILIVVYPYMTGLVAGAFTVSSMYHVFGIQKYKPVARFALLTALCFMLFVPAPLLLHLGHPERAFNRPHGAPGPRLAPHTLAPRGHAGGLEHRPRAAAAARRAAASGRRGHQASARAGRADRARPQYDESAGTLKRKAVA